MKHNVAPARVPNSLAVSELSGMTQITVLHQRTGLSLYCQVEGKTIYELVIDELEGEVTGQTRDALDDHLLQCPTCCDVYIRLKNIIRVVRAYPERLAALRPPRLSLKKERTEGQHGRGARKSPTRAS